MAGGVSQATAGPWDPEAGLPGPPQRNGSDNFPLDTPPTRARSLAHPGSKSDSSIKRPERVSSLARDVRRWPGSGAGLPSRFGEDSLGNFDYDAISDDSTPTPMPKLPQRIEDEDEHSQNLEALHGDNTSRGLKKWRKKKESKRRVPEQRITLFAFRLAFIEKAASGIGALAFVWATVVILGGFASTISFHNFLVVALIIVAESSRIFYRSHELEWQNFSTKSKAGILLTGISHLASGKVFGNVALPTSGNVVGPKVEAKTPAASGNSDKSDSYGSTSKHKRLERDGNPRLRNKNSSKRQMNSVGNIEPTKSARTWSREDIPILPFLSNVLTAHSISRFLYFLQIASAVLCIGLSLWGLSAQGFCGKGGDKSLCEDFHMNVSVSVNLFYGMAVLEAGLFLLEKGYFEYRMRYKELLNKVREEVNLGEDFGIVFDSFYYTVYNKCLQGSVFDGLDMDLVAFGIEWLETENLRQQLYGAKLLNKLVKCSDNHPPDDLAAEALRRLGTTPGIIERLVEMLSWGSQEEQEQEQEQEQQERKEQKAQKKQRELVGEIADIVLGLVAYDRNASRLVAVPGFLDAVAALLKPIDRRLTSLQILVHLCKSHKNTLKIGETKGLLSDLVNFIKVYGKSNVSKEDRHSWEARKQSLQVLSALAAAPNTSGRALRQQIAAGVSSLKNLRDIIDRCDDRPDLQVMAITILYHLALDDDVRSAIGATGGIVRLLFELLPEYGDAQLQDKDRKEAAKRAGETLTRLTMQNKSNCLRLLNLKDKYGNKPLVDVMIETLKNDTIASCAGEILRSVSKYADDSTKEKIAILSAPIVLEYIFIPRKDTRSLKYEVSLGLACSAVYSFPIARYREALGRVDKTEFVLQLIRNLMHTPTTKTVPRIRRYSVEFIIALIEKDDYFLDAFQRHNLNLKSVLEKTLDSISEVENYILFSGFIGYAKHDEDMENLVLRCIQAVDYYNARSNSEHTSTLSEEAYADDSPPLEIRS